MLRIKTTISALIEYFIDLEQINSASEIITYLILDSFCRIILSFSMSFSSAFGMRSTIEMDLNQTSEPQVSRKAGNKVDSMDSCRYRSMALFVNACNITYNLVNYHNQVMYIQIHIIQ